MLHLKTYLRCFSLIWSQRPLRIFFASLLLSSQYLDLIMRCVSWKQLMGIVKHYLAVKSEKLMSKIILTHVWQVANFRIKVISASMGRNNNWFVEGKDIKKNYLHLRFVLYFSAKIHYHYSPSQICFPLLPNQDFILRIS